MKLENQVVSLDLAKRLKELGVKQESLFWWNRLSDEPNGTEDWDLRNFQSDLASEVYSAFTVAELGEILPIRARSERWEKWYCTYNPHDSANADGARIESAITEADARAKMLTYLLENKLTTNE